MAIRPFAIRESGRRLGELPIVVPALDYENLLLGKEDPAHLSLRFKKVTDGNWSARVGLHYRAVGHFVKEGFLWEWIGSHAEYDRLA